MSTSDNAVILVANARLATASLELQLEVAICLLSLQLRLLGTHEAAVVLWGLQKVEVQVAKMMGLKPTQNLPGRVGQVPGDVFEWFRAPGSLLKSRAIFTFLSCN